MPVRTVALAILYREGQFLLQLRDDIVGIPYPGQWALFGGHLEAGETPPAGLQRELQEEIGYFVPDPLLFGIYSCDRAIRHVYHAPLTVPLNELVLGEGWDFALVPVAAIRQGSYYSVKAGEIRPLGAIHQKILLDFHDGKGDTMTVERWTDEMLDELASSVDSLRITAQALLKVAAQNQQKMDQFEEEIELVKQRQLENDQRFNVLLEEVRYLIRGNQQE